MTDKIKTLFEEIKSESLSQSERATMRNSLQLFVSEHPARAPLYVRVADAFSNLYERLEALHVMQARGVLSAACALVLVIGVGTSYAAEGALPGDPLYAVKIYLNESITGSFARTEAAKAEWNTEIVTRRLEEAEQLALTGKFTPAVRAELESAIAISTSNFNASVAEVANSDDPTAAARINSTLEATLAGHEDVLALIAAEKDPTIGRILAAVSIQKSVAEESRTFAEARVSNSSDRGKIAAQSTRKNTRDAIQKANAKIATAKARNTSVSTATLSMRVAADTAADGEAKYEAGEYGEAFATLQSAARTAERAEVHADAEARLKSSLLSITAALAPPAATTTATSTSATSTATTTESVQE